MEVKFEDFEADAMGMTENIYQSLSCLLYTSGTDTFEGGARSSDRGCFPFAPVA